MKLSLSTPVTPLPYPTTVKYSCHLEVPYHLEVRCKVLVAAPIRALPRLAAAAIALFYRSRLT